MQIFEKIMTSLGPVVGGIVALLFGAQAMFVFGALLLLVAVSAVIFHTRASQSSSENYLETLQLEGSLATLLSSNWSGEPT